jgi:Fe-S-cluster-containing dehydrogenase component/formate-dependent nitrite reductase membrane component NrfD
VTTYGFVIDQTACIGCHACTIACKSENQVPLGVFRTWVKYVEKGTYPNTRRHFLVQRCNHCANPPCVTICPTQAMFRRKDGIVDFDNTRCIGCKACMQACPYDAIYIDPETETAAKCHYCAHRTELGLQPACVIACPEEAIISGDLDDPNSRISRLVGRENVRQRRADQGTQPKLWYIGAEEAAINPEFFSDPQGSMWSQHRDPRTMERHSRVDGAREVAPSGVGAERATPRAAVPGASVAAGFLTEGGQVNYNIAHEQPWGFLVAAYLWTKSIGAGAYVMLALAMALGLRSGFLEVLAPIVALVFIGLTSALLIADLKHPERFLYILTKSNFRSWLVWGAYILLAFGLLAALTLGGVLLGSPVAVVALLWPGTILAVLSAIYSGFLFGQAEGRDYWQSPLLPVHLLAQAVVAGSGALLIVAAISQSEPLVASVLITALAVGLCAHLGLIAAETCMPHANTHIARAVHTLATGPLRARFWGGALGLGVAVPLALVAMAVVAHTATPAAIGAIAALAGLLVYEDVWVTAGQSVPMS